MSCRRNIIQGEVFHVYNRGSRKSPIYFSDEDMDRFLLKCNEYSSITKDSILQYCFLPNHFHLLIKAESDQSISKLMQRLQTSHSKYICAKYNLVGSIFQHRFKSKLIKDLNHLKIISRYIHRNHIEYYGKAGTFDYPWSSINYYLDHTKEDLIISHSSKVLIENLFCDTQDHQEYILSDTL